MACASLPMTVVAPQPPCTTKVPPYSNSSSSSTAVTSSHTQSQAHSHTQSQSQTQTQAPRRSPYRVIEELGSGLQGRVLLALDQDEQKYVAVKVPSAFSGDDSSSSSSAFDARLLEYQVQSILLERKAQRLVSHENVLKYVRTVPGKKHGVQYAAMVMEYASNGDFFDIIADTGALSPQTAKVYFHQLMLGIQACHAAGVIHRDIKPENLLLDENFTLKICDFGLAHVAPGTRSHRNAHRAMLRDVSGTALYMAPEVTREKPFKATPVDVWSAGVVLFILLTSFPPFQAAKKGDSWFDCIASGRMDIFWSAQTEPCFDAIDSDARDLISGMLCVEPEKRLSVTEVLQHPWLRDVHLMDRRRVYTEMRERRHYSLRCGKNA